MAQTDKTASILQYSAPICITLAGDTVTQYGRPALMIALDERVSVYPSTTEHHLDKTVHDIYSLVYERINQASPRSMKCSVYLPYDIEYRAVQSALIVCLVAWVLCEKMDRKPDMTEIQNHSFEIEKKLFQNYSHAQTVNCIQGGLLFYRKEFEFYKTIVKLPMKIPNNFLVGMKLTVPDTIDYEALFDQKSLFEEEKRCKRLIFAIGRENYEGWSTEIFSRQYSSDIYISQGKSALIESHNGLTME